MFNSSSLNYLLQYLHQGNRFYIAYSGGLDSHVLLHALAMLAKEKGIMQQLQAIHINHGWNTKAETWAKHCQLVCKNLNIHCQVITVNAKPLTGESLEDTARNARYQALAECLSKDDYLLTAHHQDDQAETLLLQLFRGAGVKGLASMASMMPFASGHHLRPLLEYSRSQLYDYALQYKLQWIEDESNLDTSFDRNYLRQILMPHIKQRWPTISTTLNRTAQHCAIAQSLLEGLADQDLQQCDTTEQTLSISALRLLSYERCCNAIRRWLQQLKFSSPTQAQLHRIVKDMLWSSDDRSPKVSWGGNEIRRYRDVLYALAQVDSFQPVCLTWDVRQPLALNGVGTLRGKQVISRGIRQEALTKYEVIVRFREGGERCQPIGRQGSHPLKKLMQEWAVPPWKRERVPLIYSNKQLIGVIGFCVCQPFAAQEGELGWDLTLDSEPRLNL